MKHKRLFKILATIEDFIAVELMLLGITFIIVNLTDLMPTIGLFMIMISIWDLSDHIKIDNPKVA